MQLLPVSRAGCAVTSAAVPRACSASAFFSGSPGEACGMSGWPSVASATSSEVANAVGSPASASETSRPPRARRSAGRTVSVLGKRSAPWVSSARHTTRPRGVSSKRLFARACSPLDVPRGQCPDRPHRTPTRPGHSPSHNPVVYHVRAIRGADSLDGSPPPLLQLCAFRIRGPLRPTPPTHTHALWTPHRFVPNPGHLSSKIEILEIPGSPRTGGPTAARKSPGIRRKTEPTRPRSPPRGADAPPRPRGRGRRVPRSPPRGAAPHSRARRPAPPGFLPRARPGHSVKGKFPAKRAPPSNPPANKPRSAGA